MGRRILAFVVLLAAVLLAVAPPALAERKVALLIGNGAYGTVGRLENPTRDAAAMEALLRKVGFDTVEVKRDLGRDGMRRALRDFSEKVHGAEIALVFYAGHGMEMKGENYLIPVDAVLERDIDVEDETVPLSRVFQVLEPAKRLRLVILDACRDNPFAPTMKRTVAGRSIGRGLGAVEVTTTDTLLAYAAKAGSVAMDGQGGNSPYTSALVKHLATPGLDVTLALRRVRDEVLKLTGGKQEPFFYGSLGGAEIALVPASVAKLLPPPPSGAVQWAAAEAARVCREVEGMGSPSMLAVLADQHKGTPAAACIAARLGELKRAEEAKAAEAAKGKAAADADAKASAERICVNVQGILNLDILKAMAGKHAGTPAAACIGARIAALGKSGTDAKTKAEDISGSWSGIVRQPDQPQLGEYVIDFNFESNSHGRFTIERFGCEAQIGGRFAQGQMIFDKFTWTRRGSCSFGSIILVPRPDGMLEYSAYFPDGRRGGAGLLQRDMDFSLVAP